MDLSDQARRPGATTALRICLAVASVILGNDAANDVAVEEKTQISVRPRLPRLRAFRKSGVSFSVSGMSKSEILTELPTLTPEERQEVRELLAEIDGTDWLDDGELTEDEKSLIDARLDECERHPGSFIPWDEAKARINASLKK